MPSLLMIRHGCPADDAVGTHYGQTDIDLSDAGRAQSLALIDRLAARQIDVVYSSDLRRAHWLADRLAAARGLAAQQLPELRERSLGIFHGLSYAAGEEAYPEEAVQMRMVGAMHRPTGGENLLDLAARVLPVTAELVATHAGQTVAVVGHGGPMRLVLGAALGLVIENSERIAIDYCGVCEVDYRQTPPRVRKING